MSGAPTRHEDSVEASAIKVARAAVAAIQARLGLILAHELPISAGWRSLGDFGCTLGDLDRRLYVETERPGQKHPCTNVLKYWPWLDDDPSRRLILVHVFVQNRHRRDLTLWVGRRMEREFGSRFRYLPFDVPISAAGLEKIAAAVAAASGAE